MTPAQAEALNALDSTLATFERMLDDGSLTPAALRMLIATLRSAVDIMEEIATAWDEKEGT